MADREGAKRKMAARRGWGPGKGGVCAGDEAAVAEQWKGTVAINGSCAGLAWSKPLDEVLRAAVHAPILGAAEGDQDTSAVRWTIA